MTVSTIPLGVRDAATRSAAERLGRALEIADRDHLTYRASWQGQNRAGEQVFMVPSRSAAPQHHVVRLSPSGVWLCGCTAASYGQPCGHVGAAWHLWGQINAAMTEAGRRAAYQYAEFAAWLEQRGY